MTIIVYKDGVMAADTAVTVDDRHCGHTKKIVRGPEGLAAGCGARANTQAFREWWMSGRAGDFKPVGGEEGFAGLMVLWDGTILRMNHHGQVYEPTGDYVTMGYGEHTAAGAIEAGAAPAQVVEIVCKLYGTCRGLQTERLQNY